MSERELGEWVGVLHRREPDVTRRVVRLARQHVGQPYRLGVLGEGGREPFDPDPLYCLSASDCVTFVEQVLAMALSASFEEFVETLQRIRYREGRVGFLTRNHFTEADWNVNNAWLLEDVTRRLGGSCAAPMVVRVDRAAFFRRFGIGEDIPVENFRDSYLPREGLGAFLRELREGDVIEFVRGGPKSPFVGHMGLLARNAGGRVTLIHSGDPAVRELPLAEYLHQRRAFTGVKVLRLRLATGGAGSRTRSTSGHPGG